MGPGRVKPYSQSDSFIILDEAARKDDYRGHVARSHRDSCATDKSASAMEGFQKVSQASNREECILRADGGQVLGGHLDNVSRDNSYAR